MQADGDVKRALWQSFIDSAHATLDHWQTHFEHPEQAQERLLLGMLSANRDCAFGRAHDFAGIRNASDFRDKVPMHTYAQLQPWIERARHESGAVLTTRPPLFFERSSGNSALQKLIPYTPEFLAQLQGSLTVWLADMYRQVPEISHGSGYWSMSPPLQQPAISANGIPVGSVSDLQYLQGSAIAGLAGTLLIPDLAHDVVHWRRQTLLALVADADLSFISVWSPTFLTSLLQPLFDTETPESRQTCAWLEGDAASIAQTGPAPCTRAGRLHRVMAASGSGQLLDGRTESWVRRAIGGAFSSGALVAKRLVRYRRRGQCAVWRRAGLSTGDWQSLSGICR